MKKPISHATFKAKPEHFIVTERLPETFSEDGEHLWLFLEKTGVNTAHLATLLAKWAKIPVRDVGYSGLKDRHAITRQWLSLCVPHGHPELSTLNDFLITKLHAQEQVQCLKHVRHRQKLNRGTHKHNHFTLTLSDIIFHNNENPKSLEIVLDKLVREGVPNFFGQQRFGHDNLAQMLDFFEKTIKKPQKNKHPHRLDATTERMVSVARSHLFNEILAKRIKDNTWRTALMGEVFNLNGTGSLFTAEPSDDICHRLETGDIHPTAPLCGKTDPKSKLPTDAALALEAAILSRPEYAGLIKGLEQLGIRTARRATRMMITELNWHWTDEHTLVLDFVLPTGSFATVFLSMLSDTLTDGSQTSDAMNRV